MGAGDLQLAHQQMTDHRLGTGQRIDATAAAVGLQGITAVVIRETGHHRNRRGALLLQA